LDINKIFGAFGSSSRDDGYNYVPTSFDVPFSLPIIDSENHPIYYIKMFEKLILNYNAYHEQLLSFFDKSDEDIDVGGIEEASKKMLHERAFSYLKKIDLKDDYHLEILRDQSSSQLKEAINKTIEYNEENEEYEKCAFFKKFLDFLNSSAYLNNKNK
jgi:hypothetical protein